MYGVRVLTTLVCMGLCCSEDGPKVTTKFGIIEGSYAISNKGMRYHAFEGIPYALPPLGDRRFEVPQPVIPWSTVLKARSIISCLGNREGRIHGVEDCLYLNIYAPPKSNSSLPVIVYIHGGAFQFGSYTIKEPYYLIDRDIIYATVNYRLGALGFLSTEDEIVPGNMGLKDQALALKWIKENIETFGGDPNRVTMVGSSAGGVSVHYHYLSPMSSGLFHAGISLSGTALNCWAQTENSREKAIKLGSMMNCPTNDTMMMIQCLKKVPDRALTASLTQFMQWHSNPFTPFGPVIEKPSPNAFIARSPDAIIESGMYYKVPWITGFVKGEGLYSIAEFAENETVLQDLDRNWESIAPILLDFYHTAPKQNHSQIANRIREFYFGKQRMNRECFHILTRLMGDRLFKVDAIKAAMAQAKTSQAPVWFYYYTYRAANSFSQIFANNSKDYGVCHLDDVYTVLGNGVIVPSATENDSMMQEMLLKLWVSMSHKRAPEIGIEWSTVGPGSGNLTEKTFNFLNISAPLQTREQMDIGFVPTSFWNSMDLAEDKMGD